ncbi:MAG: preprotein translocase subunit SecG [Bacteroidetes bacterium]|nr:preprotein translocase subunit SecG [Bacteroidota bacterium]
MFIIVGVLIVIVSVLLSLIVLIQKPKGGGLNAFGGTANQVFGASRTADFVEKATWSLAGTMIILVLCSAMLMDRTVANPNADGKKVEKVKKEQTMTEEAMKNKPSSGLPK